jgi:putative Mn2+ efflux pump MntP
MINYLTYLIGAAVVGIIHMSAPDHWATLCLLAKNKQWARKKLFGISFVTATGHVILSVVMGLIIVGIGLVFSHLISYYLDTGIGIIMVIAGLFFGVKPLVAKEKHHNDYEKEEKITSKLMGGIGYFVVLGAALSPDPTIIPIYLSAIPAGFYFALELSVIFAAASILTLLLFVQLGAIGLGKVFEKIPEKYNDSLVGFIIAGIGIYVLVSVYVG